MTVRNFRIVSSDALKSSLFPTDDEGKAQGAWHEKGSFLKNERPNPAWFGQAFKNSSQDHKKQSIRLLRSRLAPVENKSI